MKLHEKTYQWWSDVLAKGEINQRLANLWLAEYEGAYKFNNLANDMRWPVPAEVRQTLISMAGDESMHQMWLTKVLFARGAIDLVIGQRPWNRPSRFWEAINEGVDSLETACAAAAYGEMLALNRFRVIVDHPGTPDDVRLLCARIIPDESNHARDLRKIAGKEAMDRIRPCFLKAKSALGLADTDEDE